MKVKKRAQRGKDTEAGYMLVAVIFLLFLFTLSLSIAVPRMSKSIQQDRERETIRRGLQYRRAVQLYYRKFHAYPPSLEALSKTNNIRFLRKKYIDPTTGKEEWKPVLFGQNKVPVAMGFFGEPMKGTTLAGTGPSGGNAATTGLGSSSSAFGSSSGLGSSSSAFGASSSTSSSTSSSSTTGGTDGSTSAGTTGSGTTGTGSSGSSSSSSSSSSGFGSGQTFGGAGIIGFKPGGTRQSVFVWKKKNHPNEWEFTYDPISDQKQISGNTGSIGTSAASTSSPIGSSSSSFGSSSSSSGSSTGTSSR